VPQAQAVELLEELVEMMVLGLMVISLAVAAELLVMMVAAVEMVPMVK